MTDQLATRRALVKRAVDELNIPHSLAMKMKSAAIIEQLDNPSQENDDMTTALTEPTMELPIVDGNENADPEAPYGRKKDGTPKAKPGPRKDGVSVPRASTGQPRAPRPTRRTNARAARTAAPDYRQGVSGLLQIPAFVLASAGRLNPALEFDGIAVATHTPAIAEALNSLALEEPRVAAVLDKILTVGPYGALLGALVPLAAQIAVNHKRLPAGTLGAMEPEALKSALIGEQ